MNKEHTAFDLEILNKLGNYHKKIMRELAIQIDLFQTNEDIYNYINNFLNINSLNKAFPIGISINHIIAHDSYHDSNLIKLKSGDFIKIDIGLIEQGNIIDSARTFTYKSYHKSIDDCKSIAKSIEETLRNEIIEGKPILIQKISTLTNDLIMAKGYNALDYLGGHTIEYGKVHGKHIILNKPLTALPKEVEQFIDSKAQINQGEMFAIEIYIGEGNDQGYMFKSRTIPTTHFQLNENLTIDKINELNLDEYEIFNKIKIMTNGLVYEHFIHKNLNVKIIQKLIEQNYIIKHEPLVFESKTGKKIKYVQYEDCFIILNNQLINLSG